MEFLDSVIDLDEIERRATAQMGEEWMRRYGRESMAAALVCLGERPEDWGY
jgi:hypothetical protein